MAGQTDFPVKTSDFLAWFKAQSGTTFHTDIEIQDLRGKGAGRGIGAKSPWKPYLDVLPTADQFGTPMFWTPEELSELQASPVASKVGKEEAEDMIRSKILPVVKEHEDVFYPSSSSSDSPKLSEEELVKLAFRMGSVIMAYAFDLEKDADDEKKSKNGDEDDEDEDEWEEDHEGKTMLGMVPMADMLNADAAFNAHIEHGEHALTATALRPIAKGEEILNYYGPLSNGELLRRYGYTTLTHRRWNLVDLGWDLLLAGLMSELPLKEQDWEKVIGMMEEDDELEEGFAIDRGADDPDSEGRVNEVKQKAGVPEELLEQLKVVMKAVKKVKPDAVPDKTVRDKVIYSAIARALEERAEQYGTTLEQDLELYAAESGNADRRRMALDVRIGEKVLLKQAIESVTVKLTELAESEKGGDKPSAKRRKV
ncbi:hypothetical protein VPNG_05826 [Cytospora leucostoma]|uniref:Rubisco LSMT substrate-binding domain-containing protein n=1 Tax=Cytospora leucostoma TaxID=1230097 RepID=A0A423X0H7_9PEZI|nr:hypothetical protein VPNG_05826 [Cytospora leucostoma]